MEVVEEPVFIFQSTIYHLQEISERTRFVVAVHGQYDACGGTVGNYVVCSPACLIRCLQGSKMFLIRGQPLRPPGSAQYPDPVPAAALQGPLLGMEVRIRRIQDLVLHSVALGPAQIRSNP